MFHRTSGVLPVQQFAMCLNRRNHAGHQILAPQQACGFRLEARPGTGRKFAQQLAIKARLKPPFRPFNKAGELPDQETGLGRRRNLHLKIDVRRDPTHTSAHAGQIRPSARIEIPIICSKA